MEDALITPMLSQSAESPSLLYLDFDSDLSINGEKLQMISSITIEGMSNADFTFKITSERGSLRSFKIELNTTVSIVGGPLLTYQFVVPKALVSTICGFNLKTNVLQL